MGSDSTTLQQARLLLGSHDFEGAIELLAPLKSPSPDEICTLANAHFLIAYHEDNKRKSKAAYRRAMKLYPQCYDSCPNPRTACRMWAYSLRVLGDENELIRAKEASGGDVEISVYHYFLKREEKRPDDEQEELVDEILSLRPDDPTALFIKSQFLTDRHEWKRAWEVQTRAINHFSEKQRAYLTFHRLLARTYLLAVVLGEDGGVYLEWAKEIAPEDTWVKAASIVEGAGTKREMVDKAKELLSGEAEFGEMPFDEWLGEEAIEVEMGDGEQENGATEKRVRKAKEYTTDSIEAMGPEMRERLIVGLLAKGLGRIAEGEG